MDHARNKNFVLLLLLLMLGCLASCSSRTPEEWLVKHIEDKYANLYVNNEPAKRAALVELRTYLKDHKLNDENLSAIKKKLHKIGDGHLVMFDDRKDKNIRYLSGIVFIPGSNYVSSCANCTPELPKDTYQILQVNNLVLKYYLESQRNVVAASTEWGREYRIIRLLQENSDQPDTVLKLKNSKGKIVSTKLHWKKLEPLTPDCVHGERVDAKTFRISVMSLWCDDTSKTGQDRNQIYDNFKAQFDEAISEASAKDNIILDLRENGGGGDSEVEYVLNAFFAKSVFMYHYKYLRKTHPGKRKHIEKYWPFKLDLWSQEEFQYTDISRKPKKQFLDNKLIVLMSSGCFSSCETIASTLKLEKRAKIIGSQSHGGSGDPVIFAIKGTPYSLNIPTSVNWQENNEFFEGVGVRPDEGVFQRPNSRSDDVLSKAIDLVR